LPGGGGSADGKTAAERHFTAFLLAADEKWADAAEALRQAQRLSPHDPLIKADLRASLEFHASLQPSLLAKLFSRQKPVDPIRRPDCFAHPGLNSRPLLLDTAMMFGRAKNFRAAARVLERAQRLFPNDRDVLFLLGRAYDETSRVGLALTALEAAAKLDPSKTDTWLALSNVRLLHADHDGALEALAHAEKLSPGNPAIATNRVYIMSYHGDHTDAAVRQAFAAEGLKVMAQSGPPAKSWPNDRNPERRLRVGYVSGDFRAHTSRFYFLPLFERHDRQTFELFAYSNNPFDDQHTAHFKTMFDWWTDIRDLDDGAAAAKVRADQIDVLVDLTNHMAFNRLGLFAKKPAPVCVTWLGSVWTTGMAVMNAAFQDAVMVPAGSEDAFVEPVARLGPSMFVYRPDRANVMQPGPYAESSILTFGYTGRPDRLNLRTLRMWARVLSTCDQSRLYLDYWVYSDVESEKRIMALLEAAGIDRARVSLGYTSPVWGALAKIDVQLDTVPHSGGTNILDSLWAGVPTLTLAGRVPVGRIGASHMHAVGLSEFIAENEDDFVRRAQFIASDMPRLASLREKLPQMLAASPLMDEAGFAARFTGALRQEWARYCRP